jgi:hypothetical protein
MTSELIDRHRAASARIAVRNGEAVSAGRFVAAAQDLGAAVAARAVRIE